MSATLETPARRAPRSWRHWPLRGLTTAVGALAVMLPLWMPLSAYVTSLLMQATTYAIAVLGLTVVLGYAGQISLAQAAFFGIGAYGVALGTTSFALPFGAALAIGIVAAGLAGVALGLTSLRVGGHYLAMVTISFQTILALVLVIWVSFTHGPDGVPGIARPVLGGHSLGDDAYLAICIGALWAVACAVIWLRSTRLGRAMRALRDNELAAEVVGVDTFRIKVIAFTLSSLLGGLGGALFAGGVAYVSPDQFTFGESVVFLTMALLGGVRTPVGAMLGTALLILLPEWLRFLKSIYLAVYGVAVILIMVFMPEGIGGFVAAQWRRLRPPRPFDSAVAAPLRLAGARGPDDVPVMSVQRLSKHFGGLRALNEVSFDVRRHEVHALIGPNGSGKTTMLNLLSGIYAPTGGRVVFGKVEMGALKPHDRACLGLGRTFQNIRLFPSMSVLDNVVVGAESPSPSPAWRNDPAAVASQARAALAFVGLADRAGEPVSRLSYGHQRLVEIARALAGQPLLILLDEPAAGLNPSEKLELIRVLRRLRDQGLAVLIIEHDMSLVEQVADRITVLNFGQCIAHGAPGEVLCHPDVVAAYLGQGADLAPAA